MVTKSYALKVGLLLFQCVTAAILETKITIKFNFLVLEVSMETSLRNILERFKPAAAVVMV